MAKVNPPPLQIPKAIFADPEIAGFFLELLTVIRQLWIRTGGSSSDIINNVTNFSAQTTIGGVSFDQRADEIDRRIAALTARLAVFHVEQSVIATMPPPTESDALKLAAVKYGAA